MIKNFSLLNLFNIHNTHYEWENINCGALLEQNKKCDTENVIFLFKNRRVLTQFCVGHSPKGC